MEEKSIKINTNIFLSDIVGYIRKGEWKVPRFQREFVWEKRKVLDLLDSMYKEFPIGSFFLWIPPEEYSHYYKDIPELMIEPASHRHYTHFILDGQQRLTSLYVTCRGLKIDGFDYSNICFDLDTEKFNTESRDNTRNISLHQILNLDDYLHIYNKLADDRKKKFMNVKNIFSKYPFPVIVIENKNVEDACKIFERINQGGKRLSIFDLVVAVTWDRDFELKEKIDDFNDKIKDTFRKIDYEIFSETLSLIINKQCTKAFQLKLTPDDVKQKWVDVEKAIGKSIQYLRTHLKVKAYSYLPYRDMLALIAYYFYNCKDSEINKSFLELWFWKAAFGNRYSGSSFSKIGEDRAYIFDPVINGESANINYAVNFDIEKLKDVNMGRSTALRNALFLILVQETPLSFLDNSPIDLEADPISEFNSSEKHHIFPKKFLSSIEIKEKKVTDLFLNFCLIDSALNKHISGKSPQDYFGGFSQKNSVLKKAIDSHLIPSDKESAVWTNDYKIFLEQRANLILMHVKKRIGDFSASIEEDMRSDPTSLIHRVEQNVRSVINDVLYTTYGENWWDSDNIVPQDIRNDATNKIKKEKARKPYISDEEWNSPMRKLEQLNIMDYPKIILKNWNSFEDIFGSKNQVEKYFDGFSSIRNHIDHIRTIDPIEKKFGETSVEWLLRCIQRKTEMEEGRPEGVFLVNEIYEEIKRRILELDPEIIEKERASRKGFAKNNIIFNFAEIRFRKDHVLVRIILRKGQLNDPRSVCIDKTGVEDKEKRRIYFEVHSLDDIEYAMDIIKQAYNFNESYILRSNYNRDWHLEKRCRPKTKELFLLIDKMISDKLNVDGPHWGQKNYVAYRIGDYNWLCVYTKPNSLVLDFHVKANSFSADEIASGLGILKFDKKESLAEKINLPSSVFVKNLSDNFDRIRFRIKDDFNIQSEAFMEFIKKAFNAFEIAHNKKKLSAYNEFAREKRLEGLSFKEIVLLWRDKKRC